MTETRPHNVLYPKFRRVPRLRVVDCQSESLLSSLKGSVLAVNPTGMDLDELMAMQAKERRQRLSKEAWDDWCRATKNLIGAAVDPIPHAIRYLQDMRGRRHE